MLTGGHYLYGTQQFNTVFAIFQKLYEVFAAVFGLMMPCSLVHNYRRFKRSVLPKPSRQEMEATNSSNTLLAHSFNKMFTRTRHRMLFCVQWSLSMGTAECVHFTISLHNGCQRTAKPASAVYLPFVFTLRFKLPCFPKCYNFLSDAGLVWDAAPMLTDTIKRILCITVPFFLRITKICDSLCSYGGDYAVMAFSSLIVPSSILSLEAACFIEMLVHN